MTDTTVIYREYGFLAGSIREALRTGDLGRLADDLAESQTRLEHAQRPPERVSTHTGSLAIRAATTETEGVRP